MGKRKLINTIKKFVENSGEPCVSMSDIEADHSPCINSIGKSTFELVERLFPETVEAVVYVHDREESSRYIPYGELSEEALQEIVLLIESYEETVKPDLELNDEEN